MGEHEVFGVWNLVLAGLILVYVIGGYFFDLCNFRCVHESAVCVLCGIVGGIILSEFASTHISFNYDIFTFLILPPIIFGAGFNCRRKKFYKYFSYISVLGVFGTLIVFFLLLIAPYKLNDVVGYKTFDGATIQLNFENFLIIAAVLCGTDTVASLAFVKSSQFPRPHAIVFGEGIMNDVVSIILSQSVMGVRMSATPELLKISEPTAGFGWALVWELISQTGYYLLTSSCVGIAFGLAVSFVFKCAWRRLNESPLKAIALIYIWSYISYIASECLGFSAILSIFWCGVVTGHYAYHSLDTMNQVLASEASQLHGYIAEAFVFGYFGVASAKYLRHPGTFSPSLIMTYALLIPATRVLVVPILTGIISRLKVGVKPKMTAEELCLVLFGGMMRGSISYALIVNYVHRTSAPGVYEDDDLVLVSTVLGVVLVNCLSFGCVLPLTMRCMLSRSEDNGEQQEARIEPLVHADSPYFNPYYVSHAEADSACRTPNGLEAQGPPLPPLSSMHPLLPPIHMKFHPGGETPITTTPMSSTECCSASVCSQEDQEPRHQGGGVICPGHAISIPPCPTGASASSASAPPDCPPHVLDLGGLQRCGSASVVSGTVGGAASAIDFPVEADALHFVRASHHPRLSRGASQLSETPTQTGGRGTTSSGAPTPHRSVSAVFSEISDCERLHIAQRHQEVMEGRVALSRSLADAASMITRLHIRKGIHQCWHQFDNHYLKPIFGGSYEPWEEDVVAAPPLPQLALDVGSSVTEGPLASPLCC